MKKLCFALLTIVLLSCDGNAQKKNNQSFAISKTDTEWKAILPSEAYYVLREQGTERPFSSPLLNLKEKGTYVCAACQNPLFKSEYKFKSGTGWPSFDREIKGNVAYEKGNKLNYGSEEHCANCGGHLGHVFNDGPKETTGLRHCINGDALNFIPEDQEK